MILKKPYAFLIKNFRKIHIILSILSIFILYNTRKIYAFFSDFVKNNYSFSASEIILKSVVNNYVYLALFLVIVALILIYIVLKVKKKPTKFYMITIIYYVLLIILIVISSYLINSLSDGLWSARSARTYRDIATIIYFAQYIFVIIISIRALGFNVKQFEFKKDLQDLEITSADNEEVELNVNFDTYKLQRFLRRLKREMGYYFKENKLIIFAILFIAILVTGFLMFKNYEKLDYNYKEGNTFTLNGMALKISSSLVSNFDLKGNVIYKDKSFVVIKFEVTNNNNFNKTFDYNKLKLKYDDKYVDSTVDLGAYFKDFGIPYMGEEINSKETKTYIIPYMIDESVKDKDFSIEVYLGKSNNEKTFAAKNANIKLNPIRTASVEVIKEANLNEEVSFGQTSLNESSLTINNVYISDLYDYTYESCYKDSCRTYSNRLKGTTKTEALVVMDYNLKIDDNSSSYKTINEIRSFTNSFMSIEWQNGDEYKNASVKYVTPKNIKDKLIIETNKEIINAEHVNLVVTIRNRSYKIKLK